jgi:mannitol-specific phosphotransferase system IIBC component
MFTGVFERVWLVRFVISLIATASVAWLVSFGVSDYVVKANTSSSNQALNALQSAISDQGENNAQMVQALQSALNAANAANGQTADALRLSLDTLNDTIKANTEATDGLGAEMNDLLAISRSQSGQLDTINGRVERIIFAVEGAGIEVNAATFRSLLQPNEEQFQIIRSTFGASNNTPILLEIKPQSIE